MYCFFVDIYKSIVTNHSSSFGNYELVFVYAQWQFWNSLNLDEFLGRISGELSNDGTLGKILEFTRISVWTNSWNVFKNTCLEFLEEIVEHFLEKLREETLGEYRKSLGEFLQNFLEKYLKALLACKYTYV